MCLSFSSFFFSVQLHVTSSYTVFYFIHSCTHIFFCFLFSKYLRMHIFYFLHSYIRKSFIFYIAKCTHFLFSTQLYLIILFNKNIEM
ncbi:hypothetical protein H5410_052759 [Solanum commersonii]|uniref:Uncharacterized protein n=1 Tax=Solanum commersonii TaxID=4109 RepID=A0A9J5X4B5_SOLCO|nr:hypothetical protein H5410_052759 [Solanum commersonii]